MASYLLILGHREGLRWVLANGRMAFARRATAAHGLTPGDDLLMYTTRGCFGNPTRDRGRIIGTAKVISPATTAARPVRVADRDFDLLCDIDVRSLAPRGQGVVIADLVDRLEVFPDPASWSTWLRRLLLALPPADARLLVAELKHVATAREQALDSYL